MDRAPTPKSDIEKATEEQENDRAGAGSGKDESAGMPGGTLGTGGAGGAREQDQ